MDVNLPRGVPLGVEAPNIDKDGDKYVFPHAPDLFSPFRSNTNPLNPVLTTHIQRYVKADRELARLVVELFKPIIDATVVVFPQQWQVGLYTISGVVFVIVISTTSTFTPPTNRTTPWQARKAADIWGTELVKTTSFEAWGAAPAVGSAGKRNGKKKKAGFGGAGGGGASVGAAAIPPGTEVLIVVAPSPKELATVRRISDELGMDTLIIVLNTPLNLAASYMNKDDGAALVQAFEPVLYLNPINDPSVKTLDNMLLYRSYPGRWQIAQKGALGPPTVLAEKDGGFNQEEMLAALQKGADMNAKPLGEKLMQGFFGGGK